MLQPDSRVFDRAIKRIVVEDLFAEYNYDIHSPNDLSRAFILYGDNGSGKTTILRTAYNLVSPERAAGHRTAVAATRFRSFHVHLNDGTVVSAERAKAMTGSFLMRISYPSEPSAECFFKWDNQARIVALPDDDEEDGDDINLFLSELEELGITTHFLAEDRRSGPAEPDDPNDSLEDVVLRDNSARFRRRRRARAIDIAVRKLMDYIRQRVVSAANTGVASVNTIYTNLLTNIANTLQIEHSRVVSIDEMIRQLEEEAARSEKFAQFGLTSPIDVSEIIKAATYTRDVPYVGNILVPYVEGLRAHLDALQGVQHTVLRLISNLNEFYFNKTVELDVTEGLKVTSRRGERLPLSTLSSGEQQLLLLFCDVLVNQAAFSIYFIDEPELSLNIKWQRNLLQALLDCVQDNNVQFVMATHSMEILALHKQQVIRLSELPGGLYIEQGT